MTLSTTILRVFTVGAILSCAIPGAWSQAKVAEKPAKTAPVKAPKAKASTKVANPRLKAKT